MASTGINTWMLTFSVLLCTVWASPEVEATLKGNATVDFKSGLFLAETVAESSKPPGMKTTRRTKRTTELMASSTGAVVTPLSFSSGDSDTNYGQEAEEPKIDSLKATEDLASEKDADEMVHHVSDEKQVLGDELDRREQMPPHITSPLSKEMIVVTKKLTHIRCQADGHPDISFTWFRNNFIVNQTSEYMKAYSNGSLLLEKFSERESGYFQCKATNIHGSSLSVIIPIFAEIIPTPVTTKNLDKLQVKVGDPLNVPCLDAPPTLPVYIKRWYLQQESKEFVINERVGYDSNGTLRFAYVLPEDSNTYRCGLVPPKDTRIISLLHNNPVEVQSNPQATDTKAKLDYYTKTAKGYVDKSVSIECFFLGRPAPMIRWFNNKNQEIKSDSETFAIEDFGRRLVIKKLSEDHEGVFSCIGANALGNDKGSIPLNVTSPPMRKMESYPGELTALSTITSPDSRTVTLHCNGRPTKGEQTNTPIWYRNGESLTQANLPDPKRYSFNQARTSLTITNLNISEDTACYQCNISNSEGYFFQDGYLRVIKSIKTSHGDVMEFNMKTADEIDLRVKANADACCALNYEWYLNGTVLRVEDLIASPVYEYTSDGDLMINKGDKKPEELIQYMGNYTCKVSNIHESVSVTFKITMFDPQQQTLVADAGGFPLWAIILICAILVVIIAVVIVVVFVKTNFPRNTYPLEKTELKHHLNPEEDLLNQSFQEI